MRLVMATYPLPYGDACHACSTVGDTVLIRIVDRDVILCPSCARKGILLNITEVDDGPSMAKKHRKKSREYEEQVAQDVGGKAQLASGALSPLTSKGDIRKQGEWRIEHKFTGAQTYPLKHEHLVKIGKVASKSNENSAMVVTFSSCSDQSYAIIPYLTFVELINET